MDHIASGTTAIIGLHSDTAFISELPNVSLVQKASVLLRTIHVDYVMMAMVNGHHVLIAHSISLVNLKTVSSVKMAKKLLKLLDNIQDSNADTLSLTTVRFQTLMDLDA